MSSFKDCLETLLNFEPHGFHVVEAIETHLKKLLKIKEGQQKLQERSKESENLILKLIRENAKIDEDKERLRVRKKQNEARMSSLRRSEDAMNIMAQQWPPVDLKIFQPFLPLLSIGFHEKPSRFDLSGMRKCFVIPFITSSFFLSCQGVNRLQQLPIGWT
ncbi:hypothetical protein CDL15_Pgr007179 [Punica granatum]|uniref:Uncharacterized protein n=1 Tax=Punica granatum TaxID=22663 RepID=A0A218X8N0_PUNGR|nr:hypothetical protein CDL15_Pgr007179 [Punica granatum]